MEEIRLIDIKEEILSDNKGLADKLRKKLTENKVLLLNIMGSPGAGKTSLIKKTIEHLADRFMLAVVEADIDSMVDSETVAALGVRTVQIKTGGFCHVDANMMEKALEQLPLEELDLIILENVGNLVCPAESDTGAMKNIVILSVPEGDDKPLKYPLAFTVADVLVFSKMDAIELFDFSVNRASERVRALSREIQLVSLSCKTSEGLNDWIDWLTKETTDLKNRPSNPVMDSNK